MFKFFEDPGHGWLRVDKQSVETVGLTRDSFTVYSYAYGPWFYLEEDCDASTFLKAYEAKHGTRPVIKCHTSNRSSPIRNYPRIK